MVRVRGVLRQRLLFQVVELHRHEIDSLGEVLAAVLQLALHLVATGEVVADDRLVVRVERVGVLGFHHDLVGFEEARHASLPLGLVLLVQLLDGLLVEAGEQAHQFFIPFHGVLVTRMLKALLVRTDVAYIFVGRIPLRIMHRQRRTLKSRKIWRR